MEDGPGFDIVASLRILGAAGSVDPLPRLCCGTHTRMGANGFDGGTATQPHQRNDGVVQQVLWCRNTQ
ncbi:MAG: hypothetical protein R2749_30500, partial [Acidimicrobiales bacterium]